MESVSKDRVEIPRIGYLRHDVNEWTNMINEGKCAAVIFLLLTLYPNLETLEIYEPEETWSKEKKWGGWLISLIRIAKRPDTNKLSLFSRLSEFALQGYDDVYLEARAQLVVPFMELPSMRKIFGRVVDGRDVQWTAGVGVSKVIRLVITGDIDRASLCSLIRGCKGLESFSFQLSTVPGWERTINIDELDSLKFGPQAGNDAACEDTDSDESETENRPPAVVASKSLGTSNPLWQDISYTHCSNEPANVLECRSRIRHSQRCAPKVLDFKILSESPERSCPNSALGSAWMRSSGSFVAHLPL